MSSKNKNLSDFNAANLLAIENKKFVVLVAEWNEEITEALFKGVLETLKKHGALDSNIIRANVPGSYELSYAAQVYASKKEIDAVIALGCVIQGETKHNDYINNAVANGLTNVSLKFNKPVVFGVLTPNTFQQAKDRAGGKHGNKGDEAAITAIKMLRFN